MTQILLVENDLDIRERLKASLSKGRQLNVEAVSNVAECVNLFSNKDFDPIAAIVDLHLPYGGSTGERAISQYGLNNQTGFSLAKKIKEHFPKTKIFGITSMMDSVSKECKDWFLDNGDPITGIGVYQKMRDWVLLRHRILRLAQINAKVKVFIVHGHDQKTKEDLVDFGKSLGWEVEILAEGLSSGRTWIERFELEADKASMAWVLFTCDEWGCPLQTTLHPELRPRPNVLLECGFFLGAYGRNSSRVLLFKKGEVALPSDLDGVARINLRGTLDESSEQIKAELRPWL